MEIKDLVCLNDGRGTRINVRTGTEAAIDLTLVSNSLAGISVWEVFRETTIGSDHYPIAVEVNLSIEECYTGGVDKWFFENADWEAFRSISEQEMEKIEVKGGVDKVNNNICNAILLAASQSIPKKGGKKKKKIVPWWTKECDKVIKSRNKAFKMLKKNHSFQNFIEYKRKQANVRRIIKNTKKEFWRKFCNTVGRETEIGQVWGMIKRMNGIKREFGYPILRDGDITAVKDEEEGKIPQSWKKLVIVPIRKPGKDCTNPGNYRPIALTSNVGKIMEKIVNERLMYHVENNNFFSKYQSGFRRGRNTMDPAVCLEHEIRKAQINRESVVAVFFDIEKAYDMMWREGLLIKLCKLGIKGQMYRWINNFLSGRAIKVRIGNSYSEKFVIENGTPQGSIVSPLLFSIMINDVFEDLDNGLGVITLCWWCPNLEKGKEYWF